MSDSAGKIALIGALRERERAYEEALERLAANVEEHSELYAAARSLREALELVRCLRRLVPTGSLRDLHAAFGAPGDFGYDTPIGDALAKLYRGES